MIPAIGKTNSQIYQFGHIFRRNFINLFTFILRFSFMLHVKKKKKTLGDWGSRDDSIDRMITFLHSSICFVVDNIVGFDSVTAPYPVKFVFQVSARQRGRDKKVLEAHWPANLVIRFSYFSESLWQKKTINTDIGSLKDWNKSWLC